MHCTWFNEKKSSFPPYIFFVGFFFSSNKSPHLLSPSSPLACPSQRPLGKEGPRPRRPAARRRAPAPAQLACSFRPRPGGRPAAPAARLS